MERSKNSDGQRKAPGKELPSWGSDRGGDSVIRKGQQQEGVGGRRTRGSYGAKGGWSGVALRAVEGATPPPGPGWRVSTCPLDKGPSREATEIQGFGPRLAAIPRVQRKDVRAGIDGRRGQVAAEPRPTGRPGHRGPGLPVETTPTGERAPRDASDGLNTDGDPEGGGLGAGTGTFPGARRVSGAPVPFLQWLAGGQSEEVSRPREHAARLRAVAPRSRRRQPRDDYPTPGAGSGLKAQRPRTHGTGRQGAASLSSSFAPALLGPPGSRIQLLPPLGFVLFPLVSRQHTRVS